MYKICETSNFLHQKSLNRECIDLAQLRERTFTVQITTRDLTFEDLYSFELMTHGIPDMIGHEEEKPRMGNEMEL